MARTPRAARAASAHCRTGSDALALADESIDKRLLPRGGLRLDRARGKHARGDARVHHPERVPVEDAHEVRIPLHAEPLTEEDERHGIEGAGDFDMPIGVDRPIARGEERKRGTGERLQRGLLDLDEVRPDLAARRAMNAEASDGPIPLPQKRILRVEAVKRAA